MKTLQLFSLLILGSFLSFGQSAIPKRLKINSMSFSLGMIADVYQKMDLNSMRDLSTNPEIFNHNLDGYEENLWRESGGLMIKLDANFSLYDPINQTYALNKEVRLGIGLSAREPLISYDKNERAPDGSYTYNESIVYCNMQNEINVSGAFLWKTGGNKKRIFRAYAGLGSNVGATINDRMVVMWNSYETTRDPVSGEYESENTEYEFTDIKAKSALFLRAYAPLGMELNLWRIKLGVESNLGLGVHQTLGGQTHFLPFSFNMLMRAGYNF